MSNLLEGQIVAVTGAASGIGAATARVAAEWGAAGVVLVDIQKAGLDATAVEVDALGCTSEIVVADLSASEGADEFVRVAADRFGRLDVAANVAGLDTLPIPIDELTDETVDRVLDINLRGLFRCVRAELRQMYRQGGGAIVNVASAVVYGVHVNMAPYAMSKFGVVGLTKVAAKEAGPRGVRVNAICPGWTDTPLAKMAHEARGNADLKGFVDRIPLRRPGSPEEIAASILWLGSDQSSFTTGAIQVVDGGRTG